MFLCKVQLLASLREDGVGEPQAVWILLLSLQVSCLMEISTLHAPGSQQNGGQEERLFLLMELWPCK